MDLRLEKNKLIVILTFFSLTCADKQISKNE